MYQGAEGRFAVVMLIVMPAVMGNRRYFMVEQTYYGDKGQKEIGKE